MKSIQTKRKKIKKTKKHHKFIKQCILILNRKIIDLKKSLKSLFHKIKHSSMRKFYVFLRNRSKAFYILILGVNFLIGSTILFCTGTSEKFLLHLVCLTVTISTTLYIGKHYIDTLEYLNKKILADMPPQYTEFRTLYSNFYTKAMRKSNMLKSMAVVTVFLWGIFSQHYIETNLVGFYAVFMVCISVSLSVIGYLQYIYILCLLFRLRKCSDIPYNQISPAYTPFLIEVATLLQRVKWCFFIEGFCYTFEYYILIPKGNITHLTVNMPDNVSFFITWAIVLLVIVLAFPTLVFLHEHLLATIIDNLKKQQIEYYSLQYRLISHDNLTPFTPSVTYYYQEIISQLANSADYPLKIQRFGTAVASIASVCIHIFTLVSQFPQLQLFLINGS